MVMESNIASVILTHRCTDTSLNCKYLKRNQTALAWSRSSLVLGHSLEEIPVWFIVSVFLLQRIPQRVPSRKMVVIILAPRVAVFTHGLGRGAIVPWGISHVSGKVGRRGESVAFPPQYLTRGPLHRSPKEALGPWSGSIPSCGVSQRPRGVWKANIGSSWNGWTVTDERRHQVWNGKKRMASAGPFQISTYTKWAYGFIHLLWGCNLTVIKPRSDSFVCDYFSD